MLVSWFIDSIWKYHILFVSLNTIFENWIKYWITWKPITFSLSSYVDMNINNDGLIIEFWCDARRKIMMAKIEKMDTRCIPACAFPWIFDGQMKNVSELVGINQSEWIFNFILNFETVNTMYNIRMKF